MYLNFIETVFELAERGVLVRYDTVVFHFSINTNSGPEDCIDEPVDQLEC